MNPLEAFIRQNFASSVRDPWPAGNSQFVTMLDEIIRHKGDKEFLRMRGQGTTTLLLATAIYAANQGLSPYTLLVFRHREVSKNMANCLRCLAGVNDYEGRHFKRRVLGFNNGSIIECVSIREGGIGRTHCIDGKMVRPSLILMDLGKHELSITQQNEIDLQVNRLRRSAGILTPAGVAVVRTIAD